MWISTPAGEALKRFEAEALVYADVLLDAEALVHTTLALSLASAPHPSM